MQLKELGKKLQKSGGGPETNCHRSAGPTVRKKSWTQRRKEKRQTGTCGDKLEPPSYLSSPLTSMKLVPFTASPTTQTAEGRDLIGAVNSVLMPIRRASR